MTGLDHILRSERWTSNLNIVHPILQNDIDRFSKWVMYAGFRTFHHYTEKEVAKWKLGQDHYGHDFISYLDEEQVEHFGLPSNTSVRAIKDGVVIAIIKNDGRFAEYETYLVVQHNQFGLASGYCHVVPKVNAGERVKKGQVIAALYDTSAETMSLPTHLHFELGTMKDSNRIYPFFNQIVDPLDILPGLRELSVRPSSLFAYSR